MKSLRYFGEIEFAMSIRTDGKQSKNDYLEAKKELQDYICDLESQLADTKARLVTSEKRLKWTQQISDGRRALMVCYRLGTHKGADAALTRIEKAEAALAALGKGDGE